MKFKFVVLTLGLVCSSEAFAAAAKPYTPVTECAFAKQASAHEKPKDQAAAEIYAEVFNGRAAPKKPISQKAVM